MTPHSRWNMYWCFRKKCVFVLESRCLLGKRYSLTQNELKIDSLWGLRIHLWSLPDPFHGWFWVPAGLKIDSLWTLRIHLWSLPDPFHGWFWVPAGLKINSLWTLRIHLWSFLILFMAVFKANKHFLLSKLRFSSILTRGFRIEHLFFLKNWPSKYLVSAVFLILWSI